jgi:hypothetical protein
MLHCSLINQINRIKIVNVVVLIERGMLFREANKDCKDRRRAREYYRGLESLL